MQGPILEGNVSSIYRSRHVALALALLAAPALTAAQSTKPVAAPGAYTPQSAMSFGAIGEKATPVTLSTPLPVGGVRETFQMVSANTPVASATVYGGDYILAQTCAGYGTLTLQVRGPDATTWLPLVTKTASDTGSGTGIALGSYAVVRVTVSGTTGCAASLSRVPA